MSAATFPVALEPLTERARRSYPALGPVRVRQLARAAARDAGKRRLPAEEDRLIAAHVTIATVAAECLTRPEDPPVLAVDPVVADCGPAERALAEHLHARLEPEELLVIALRITCDLARRRASGLLNLTVAELRRLEDSARAKAESLVLAFHHELICEPAELSDAASPKAVSGAVRRHLASCRSCRREFDARVAVVLGASGGLELPLPPLQPTRPNGRRWWWRSRT